MLSILIVSKYYKLVIKIIRPEFNSNVSLLIGRSSSRSQSVYILYILCHLTTLIDIINCTFYLYKFFTTVHCKIYTVNSVLSLYAPNLVIDALWFFVFCSILFAVIFKQKLTMRFRICSTITKLISVFYRAFAKQQQKKTRLFVLLYPLFSRCF